MSSLSPLSVGMKLRIFYGKDNPNNELCHVAGVVDNDMIVTKRWSKTKKRWRYAIDHIRWFRLLEKSGCLTVIK